jgi:hypothetical protein
MSNSIILNNIATAAGGALVNYTNSGSTLLNCSFMNNSAPEFQGSSVYNELNSQTTATNCILWGSDTWHIFQDLSSSFTITYSIVKYPFLYPGTGNKIVDPLFVDATNGDLHLNASSPAINSGIDAANNELTDFDGNSRISGGRIDMGAYEFGAPTCTDETAPTFTGSYNDINLGCNPANPDGSLGTVTATDGWYGNDVFHDGLLSLMDVIAH